MQAHTPTQQVTSIGICRRSNEKSSKRHVKQRNPSIQTPLQSVAQISLLNRRESLLAISSWVGRARDTHGLGDGGTHVDMVDLTCVA
jgi:hypothetical protein